MALSGTINGTTNNQYVSSKIVWSAVQSVDGNYSDVSATLSYSRTNTGYTTEGNWSGSITIGGLTKSGTARIRVTYQSNTVAITATQRIYHNTDGTKSITISASGKIGTTSVQSTSCSASVTLDTIPRASTISLQHSSANFGASNNISISRASTAFVHDLAYKFETDSNWTVIANNVGTSQSWTVPDKATSIPNKASGTFVVRCITKNNGTIIGTTTVQFIGNVPASIVPVISSVNVSEGVSAIASKFDAFVQSKSRINVQISASGASGSTIVSYKSTIENTAYLTANFLSNIVVGSGAIPIVTTVTDSRGRTASRTTNVTVVEYSSPRIISFSAFRINASGNADDDGNRIGIRINYAISAVGNRNDRTYAWKYKRSSDADFSTFATGQAEWAFDGTLTFTASPTISTDYPYVVRAEISDYFQTVKFDVNISTAFTLMDFRSTGKGMAIGKVSQNDWLEVAMLGEFTKGIKFDYNVRKSIPENANLNDYWKSGHYVCGSDSRVSSISNCPTENAFLLDTYSGTGNDAIEELSQWMHIIQTIEDYNGKVFKRIGYTSSGVSVTWSGWEQQSDFSLAIHNYQNAATATSATDTDLITINLPKGYTYLLFGQTQINVASPSTYLSALFSGATFAAYGRGGAFGGGGVTTWAMVDTSSAAVTVKLRGYHNYGSPVTMTGNAMILRLPHLKTF